MKLKLQYKSGPMDNCQTPPYALDPILPYLDKSLTWWEPAMGKGNIVNTLVDKGYKIHGTDIEKGWDYFYCELPTLWDVSITNPPYGLKFKWLARCYELGKPFALLVPVEMLGAKQTQELLKVNPFEIMLLNRRVNFEMPNKGYNGAGAQFPVFWLTSRILPEKVMFGEINQKKPVI